MVSTLGQTVESIKVSGITESNMVKANILVQMVALNGEFGKKERDNNG